MMGLAWHGDPVLQCGSRCLAVAEVTSLTLPQMPHTAGPPVTARLLSLESGAAGASRSVSPSIGQLSVYGDEGMPPYGEPDAPAATADSRGLQDHR